MQRYSEIVEKIPREILLLKSYPCLYGKCTFCNYILDNSISLEEIQEANDEIINKITGKYGVIEILNSGSVFELPDVILEKIKTKVNEKNIHTIYFESYYGYRKRLDEMRKYFTNQQIRYRIGIETFDDEFRANILNKPFPTNDIQQLADDFYACCLLICIQGQTKEQIIKDIATAQEYFKEITINVFINNDTPIKQDYELVKWFVQDIYPSIKDKPNIEILLDNKDLGIFVQ